MVVVVEGIVQGAREVKSAAGSFDVFEVRDSRLEGVFSLQDVPEDVRRLPAGSPLRCFGRVRAGRDGRLFLSYAGAYDAGALDRAREAIRLMQGSKVQADVK